MSNPLATYINDHLAGSAYAVDLVEFLRDTWRAVVYLWRSALAFAVVGAVAFGPDLVRYMKIRAI